MTVFLNIFKRLSLPYFWADFEKPCIKIIGLPRPLLQNIPTVCITFPFNKEDVSNSHGPKPKPSYGTNREDEKTKQKKKKKIACVINMTNNETKQGKHISLPPKTLSQDYS